LREQFAAAYILSKRVSHGHHLFVRTFTYIRIALDLSVRSFALSVCKLKGI